MSELSESKTQMLSSRAVRGSLESDPCHFIVHVALGKSDGVIWFLSLQRKGNNAFDTLPGCCGNLLTPVKLPGSEEAYISAWYYSHSKCFLLRRESQTGPLCG